MFHAYNIYNQLSNMRKKTKKKKKRLSKLEGCSSVITDQLEASKLRTVTVLRQGLGSQHNKGLVAV